MELIADPDGGLAVQRRIAVALHEPGDAVFDTCQMPGQREAGLRCVGHAPSRRVELISVQTDEKGDRLVNCVWADLLRVQGPAVNEFVKPEVIAVIAVQGLRK